MTRTIRMFPDSGVDWPFWETSNGPSQPSPADLGLSAEVTRRLRDWVDFWRIHCEAQLAWDAETNRQAFLKDGEELRAAVLDELPEGFEVTLLPGISGTGEPESPALPPAKRKSDRGPGIWTIPSKNR